MGHQSLVLLLELLRQTLSGGGGEDPQLILRKRTKEAKELKEGGKRTQDRRFPLPGRRYIHLDRDTIIHLVPPSLLVVPDTSTNPGSSLCSQRAYDRTSTSSDHSLS